MKGTFRAICYIQKSFARTIPYSHCPLHLPTPRPSPLNQTSDKRSSLIHRSRLAPGAERYLEPSNTSKIHSRVKKYAHSVPVSLLHAMVFSCHLWYNCLYFILSETNKYVDITCFSAFLPQDTFGERNIKSNEIPGQPKYIPTRRGHSTARSRQRPRWTRFRQNTRPHQPHPTPVLQT